MCDSIFKGSESNYTKTGVTWFQDSVCNAPGQVEAWGELFSQGELHEAIRTHGGSFTLYRYAPVTPKSSLFFYLTTGFPATFPFSS